MSSDAEMRERAIERHIKPWTKRILAGLRRVGSMSLDSELPMKTQDDFMQSELRSFAKVAYDAGYSSLQCPNCGGSVVSTAHGPYCPKETCKWGWEVEMDGSPLKAPSPHAHQEKP